MANPKHILVIRLSAMGDVAMTVPVLRALVSQHPNIEITVLTKSFFKPFFQDLKNVQVITADFKGNHKGIFGLYKLSNEIKNLNIDAITDLHNVLRTKILKVLLPKIPFYQIDKGRSEKKALISGKSFKQLKSTHQRYVDVFEALGISINLQAPIYPPKRDLTSKVQSAMGNGGSKWIGIAPFAAHQGKMYPLDLMEQVIEQLSQAYKVILFGGGESEVKILNALASRFENVVNVSGFLTLEEELSLISNLDVMLSMDSGNGHIAAMLGTKVVTLWGVTHPYAGFSPFDQPMDCALLSDRKKYPLIPTSVYGNKYPENYEDAMRSIPVETVVKKIESVI